MLIALIIYLWFCTSFAALLGLSFVRPINWFDVLSGVTLPIWMPFVIIRSLILRLS